MADPNTEDFDGLAGLTFPWSHVSPEGGGVASVVPASQDTGTAVETGGTADGIVGGEASQGAAGAVQPDVHFTGLASTPYDDPAGAQAIAANEINQNGASSPTTGLSPAAIDAITGGDTPALPPDRNALVGSAPTPPPPIDPSLVGAPGAPAPAEVAARATPAPDGPLPPIGPVTQAQADAGQATLGATANAPPPVPFGAREEIPGAAAGAGAPGDGSIPLGPPTAAGELPANLGVRGEDVQIGFDNPDLAASEQALKDNPLLIRDPAERQRALDDLAVRDPAKFSELVTRHEDARRLASDADRLRAINQDYDRQRENLIARQKADQSTRSKLEVVTRRSQEISQEALKDPRSELGIFDRLRGIAMAVIGGLIQGRIGGPNIGLDAFNKELNDRAERDRINLQRRRETTEFQSKSLTEQLRQNADDFQNQETLRLAGLQHADQVLAIQQQNFDPEGTTALKIASARAGLASEQTKVKQNFAQKNFENELKLEEARRAENAQNETRRHNQAEELISVAKIKGAGAGGGEGAGAPGAAGLGGADGTHRVFTGIVNPFDRSQGLFGIRPIGGKGHEKEFEEVNNAVSSYASVQDDWADMRELGRKISYHKSLGESVFGHKYADTDAQEFDQIKHRLVVNLTKALGDKLTQGQIDEQSHRIPDRTTFLQSIDTDRLIADAQLGSDKEVSRYLTQRGVNPDGLIQSAQSRREFVRPSAQQDLDSANAAIANNPGNKDALEAQRTAQDRLRSEQAEVVKGQEDADRVRTLPPAAEVLPKFDAHAAIAERKKQTFNELDDTGTKAPKPDLEKVRTQYVGVQNAIDQSNRSAQRYEQIRKQFDTIDQENFLKGAKKGDVEGATREHKLRVGKLSSQVIAAHDAAIRDRAQAQQAIAAREAADRELDSRLLRPRQDALPPKPVPQPTQVNAAPGQPFGVDLPPPGDGVPSGFVPLDELPAPPPPAPQGFVPLQDLPPPVSSPRSKKKGGR